MTETPYIDESHGRCSNIQKPHKNESYAEAWLCAIITVLAFGVISMLLIPVSYVQDIADDNCIGSYLAGYWTGTPEWKLPFIHPLFTYPVSMLYRFLPEVHWYPLALLGSFFLSAIVISRCMYELCQRASLPIWIGFVSSLAWYALACYDQVYLSFSTVPGELCAAAAAMILVEEEKRKHRIIKIILTILLIYQALVIRYESAYSGLCFCFAAFAYRVAWTVFKGEKGKKTVPLGKLIVGFLAVAVIFCGIIAMEKSFERMPENQDYFEFHKACAALIDYSHTAEEVEAAKEQNDISDALYDLLKRWCWMDPKIDADFLFRAAGIDTSTASRELLSTMPLSKDLLLRAWRGIKVNRASLYPLLCNALFVPGMLLVLPGSRKWRMEYLFVFGTLAGATVLLLYCGLLGRLPIRVIRIVAIPCFTVCLILFLKGAGRSRPKKRLAKAVLPLLLVCLAAFCCMTAAKTSYSEDMRNAKERGLSVRQTMDELVVLNPGKVFFYSDFHCCYSDTFPNYGDRLPTNAIYWGGAYYLLEPYDHQLARNGIDYFDISLFLQDNVFYISDERYRKDDMKALKGYLQERFGEINTELICALDQGSVTIYHFSLAQSKEVIEDEG